MCITARRHAPNDFALTDEAFGLDTPMVGVIIGARWGAHLRCGRGRGPRTNPRQPSNVSFVFTETTTSSLLELWIDRESLLLVQLQMTFPGGDRKTIRLDEVTVNVPVTDEMFLIRP